MNYKGILYGKVGGKYIKMTETVNDLENKIQTLKQHKYNLQKQNEELRDKLIIAGIETPAIMTDLSRNS